MKQRIITGLLLAGLTLTGIMTLPLLAFNLLTAFIMALAAFEWANLAYLEKTWQAILYSLGNVLLLALSTQLPFSLVLHVSLGLWLVALGWMTAYSYGKAVLTPATQRYLFALFGPALLIPCWQGLALLRLQGNWWIILLLVLVYGADTGAYFTGRFFGKHSLAPALSPKKTWEGLLGGIITAAVLAIIAALYLNLPKAYGLKFAGVGMLTVLFSVAGDLFESMLKRYRGIKDSGKLLPGHGGILDRIDSLLAACPWFAWGLLLLH